MKLAVTLFLMTMAGVLDLTTAYPTGVPDGACDSMWPGHKMNDTKLSPQYYMPDYKIYTDLMYDVMPGSWVTVTIMATNQNYFKGFLLQAHWEGSYIWDPENPPPRYGEFLTLTNDTQVACSWQGATHSMAKKYYTATVYWVAPDMMQDTPVQFVATIVQDYNIFFMDMRSDTIWVKSNVDQYGSPSSHTAAAVIQIMAVAILTVLWQM